MSNILIISLGQNLGMRGPYSKNIRFSIIIPPITGICADGNPRHPIHCFQQLALNLKLIVGQANLQLRPAT